MKTIKNEETEITNEKKQKLTYFELAEGCINVPPQNGFDIQEMNKRLRVIEKLKGKETQMEDADFEKLKECVVNMKWGFLHKDIMKFINYIREIK